MECRLDHHISSTGGLMKFVTLLRPPPTYLVIIKMLITVVQVEESIVRRYQLPYSAKFLRGEIFADFVG